MQVEAIGSPLNTITQTEGSSISQEEFVQLFLTQLTYQDPLEPLDNSEFLAQLAQFSSIEQQRQNGIHLENISEINSIYQASTLVGKTVDVQGADGGISGVVISVSFDPNGVSLTVERPSGAIVDRIRMSQIQNLR
ncbi:MAG: flagellar hook capping FlgD N-terminal domain-containing protein [Pseudomonadota bacterium]